MAYIGKSPTGTGVRSRFYYTQTSGGGTSISGTDDSSKTLTFTDGEYIDVFLNGVLLVAGTDYNTNTANTISGLAALANGDVVEVVVYDIFTVADTVSASQGGTFNAGVTMSDGLTVDDDGATVLTLDRATSDGTVIDIQKDGTSVGTLAARVSNLRLGTDDIGLEFHKTNNTILPANMTANTLPDNTTDLGQSNVRFKDLYLGGNLYVGGTGSDNALDDFEQGTCTITADAATTSPTSPTSNTAYYTKIGNSVTIWCDINNISMSGAAGNVRLTGLPFGASGNGSNKPGVAYVNNLVFQNTNEMYVLVETSGAGNTHLNWRICRKDNNAATLITATTGHIQEGVTDLRFQITYKVN